MHEPMTICDLTQSYAETGGGIRTYLERKRQYLQDATPHRHLLIVPGAEDRTIPEGRHLTVEIKSPQVPGSPMYRLLLRNRAVIGALREYAPDVVECLDAYNLPWAAIKYRKEVPSTILVAGYRTDFPTAYVERFAQRYFNSWVADKLKGLAHRYARRLYKRFDGVYALNRRIARRLRALGVGYVDQLPLGVDLDVFTPDKRDDAWRASLGVAPDDPLLIYAGRIDQEKRSDLVVEAFKRLPSDMNASLIMLGSGVFQEDLKAQTEGLRAHFPGFVNDRASLARALASSDIYVSGMPYETFGISIIEAQSAGLPVIGVASGAMPDRVPAELGYLGPVGDADAMARHIEALWRSGEARGMGRAARAHVERSFSWTRTFEHLLGVIYPTAMARNGRRPGLPETNVVSLEERRAA